MRDMDADEHDLKSQEYHMTKNVCVCLCLHACACDWERDRKPPRLVWSNYLSIPISVDV